MHLSDGEFVLCAVLVGVGVRAVIDALHVATAPVVDIAQLVVLILLGVLAFVCFFSLAVRRRSE